MKFKSFFAYFTEFSFLVPFAGDGCLVFIHGICSCLKRKQVEELRNANTENKKNMKPCSAEMKTFSQTSYIYSGKSALFCV